MTMSEEQMGIECIPVSEFHARLDAQRVGKFEVAVVCPVCGTIQSVASLVAAGATHEDAQRKLGFACEGRFTNAGPWARKPSRARKAKRGCDWSLGGLFKIHTLEVEIDGEVHPCFEVATPEQAQTLAAALAAPRVGGV